MITVNKHFKTAQGRSLLAIIGIIAIMAVAIYLFGPGLLPSGVGVKPIPIAVHMRPSVMALGMGAVAVLENQGNETVYDVTVTCTDKNGKTQLHRWDAWKAGDTEEIGPVQGWLWESGETLDITASGYLPKRWVDDD